MYQECYPWQNWTENNNKKTDKYVNIQQYMNVSEWYGWE